MSTIFSTLTDRDKKTAVERLIADSTPRDDFFLMIVLAVCMATFGLLLNSASVIVGSMLIAPLLSPILGVGMGVVMADRRLITRSGFTVLKAVAFAVPTAALVALLFSGIAGLGPELNAQIEERLRPDLIAALVALVAGVAASYALIRPQLNASLPGVAVSVALVPPLAVTGIGISRFDWHVIANAFVLFLVNAGLIIVAATTVFSLMRLHAKLSIATQAMRREDEQLRREQERARHDDEA